MRIDWFLASLGVACLACQPPVRVDDAGVTPEKCEVTLRDGAPVSVSEGGRVTVTLVPSVPSLRFGVADASVFTVSGVGDTQLTLKAPYGQVGEHPLRLSLTCPEQTATQTLPVTVRALSWSRATEWTEGVDGPPGREYGSMWVDDTAPDTLWVYGGFHYQPQQFTPGKDLWALNLLDGKWQQLMPSGPAPELTGGRLVPVPGTGDALYLGGVNTSFKSPYALKRLHFSFDSPSWADEPLAFGAGKGDYQPGFFYDSRRGRFVSVCGANTTIGYHCSVRAYTPGTAGGKWEDVAVAGTAPQGRNGHFFAYDAETDRLMMFGGDNNGSTLGDTWALELGETPPRWVALGDDPSMKRRNGAFVLDAENHRFFMWGGTGDGATARPDLWALDLERGKEQWVRVQITGKPPDRASGMAVFDAKRKRFLMGFGNSDQGVFVDLWALQL
ncbi:MAG: hypothetical protein K1X64_07820 [Myxococcaceae bacterium]|nr:hypothetical protein [Myxococcaceae bacterium]